MATHSGVINIIKDNDDEALMNLVENLMKASIKSMEDVIKDQETGLHSIGDEMIMGMCAHLTSEFLKDVVKAQIKDDPDLRKQAKYLNSRIRELMTNARQRERRSK